MDEKTKSRYSYLVACAPIVIACMQVWLGSAPVAMLAFGVAMAVVAFALFRFLAGIRIFTSARRRFGKAHALRAWQAPALWIPLVVASGAVLFVWLVR